MTGSGGVFLIARLARKELREILRDRRTIVTLVLMPVLLYPLLSIAFRQYMAYLATEDPNTRPVYRVAVLGDAEAERMQQLLPNANSGNDPELKYYLSENLYESVRNGDAQVGISFTVVNTPAGRLGSLQSLACEILVQEESALGLKAAEYLRERLTEANIQILQDRLPTPGGTKLPRPVEITTKLVPRVEGKKPSPLASLIPLILVLMTITGGVYPSIDLTAGERERGTLEILMAAPIPRMGLLVAKYIAVLTVAMLTGLVNLSTMTITLQVFGLSDLAFGEGGLNFGTVIAVFGLLLLFAMFFSAVLLAVTSFARSFKEAQSYLIPLMLASIAPGMLAMLPGLNLGGMVSVTPLLNVVLLAREIFRGGVPLTDAVIVVVSTLFYALVALALAARLFGAEAVLYSDQSHWSDLLRRPAQPREAPTLTAALGCLAILFPITILLGESLARIHVPQNLQLLLSMALSAILFVGLPLLSARLSRVQLVGGFALRPAPLIALAGAIVLGLSFWPIVGELIAVQKVLGFSTMPSGLRERLQTLLEQRRNSAPVLTLLTFAVVVPIVEELFFRGFLFSAFQKSWNDWKAILVSSVLFGLFHLFTGGIVLVERLVPTALMGLALGFLRSRSRSVLPGILLHALHNGFLALLALYPALFGTLADAMKTETYIPWPWVVASAVGIGIGLALVVVSRPRKC